MSLLPVNALISRAAGALGIRTDPHAAFNFWVEIEGLIAGGFTEISGLKMEIDVQAYQEGGQNTYVHQFPGRIKESTLTLKRGLTDIDTLWPWCYDVMHNTIDGGENALSDLAAGASAALTQVQTLSRSGAPASKRRNLTIYLLDNAGLPAMWWDVMGAFPTAWEGPALGGDGNAVAFESLTLAHHGLSKPQLSQATSAARAAAGAVRDLL